MKEDILEQLLEDYLQTRGFFTMHNIKFQPEPRDAGFDANQDRVPSDIDIIGHHPRREPPDGVWVVSCKSWMAGFNPAKQIADIERNRRVAGREAWRRFREMVSKKWADALVRRVEALTGSTRFTYVTAVTKLKGDRGQWENHTPFKDNLRGNPIRLLTLEEILTEMYSATGTSVASSEVGRLLQVIKASGWKP